MDFTFSFLRFLWIGVVLFAPLLGFFFFVVVGLGQIVGKVESWKRFDAFYWSMITAFTVGYGDMIPRTRLTKILALIVAITGILFTGLVVAIAVNAGLHAFEMNNDMQQIKEMLDAMD